MALDRDDVVGLQLSVLQLLKRLLLRKDSRNLLTPLCGLVDAENGILAGGQHEAPVCGGKEVLRREHLLQGLFRSFLSHRHIHGHGVAIEVSVEPPTNQWMDLDGLPRYKDRLERQGGEYVERRVSLHDYGSLSNHPLQRFLCGGVILLDHAPRLTWALSDAHSTPQLSDDERLVRLHCHIDGNAHLVHL